MTLKKHNIAVLALALVFAAFAATSASARPIDEVGPATLPTQQSGQHGNAYRAAASTPTPVNIESVSADSGFDWGDAGIGAGAAFAVTMIGLGGALLLTNRNGRPQRQATPA
jgi:uncharacterized protein YwlG (UPF0340 family)